MLRLSVIVPFHNAADTLARCLDGLSVQEFPRDRFEVIAVDNNSTDGSAEIARRYAAVRLCSEPNQGAYAARNRGVAAARGAILAFTDPDCIPTPSWLAVIDREMQAPDTAVLLGGYVIPRGYPGLALLVRYENEKDSFVFSTDSPELYYGHTNNMAVRRDAFERFGPFVERPRGADTIFVRRVVDALTCHAARYSPDLLVEHLELSTVRTYYRKLVLYGESRESYRRISWTRPLTLAERIAVFRRTCARHALSPSAAAQLFSLLSAGLVAWRLGRARAQWKRARPGGASGQAGSPRRPTGLARSMTPR